MMADNKVNELLDLLWAKIEPAIDKWNNSLGCTSGGDALSRTFVVTSAGDDKRTGVRLEVD